MSAWRGEGVCVCQQQLHKLRRWALDEGVPVVLKPKLTEAPRSSGGVLPPRGNLGGE